jgi:hypothetical protein
MKRKPVNEKRRKSKKKAQNGVINIKELVDFFANEFLQACFRKGGKFKKETWHVVFSFGSIVRVELPDLASPSNWVYQADEYKEASHRFICKEDQALACQASERDYDNLLLRKIDCKQKQAIQLGMKLFMESGYPVPGGEGADSVTVDLAAKGDGIGQEHEDEVSLLWGTLFCSDSACIQTLAIESEYLKASAVGRECRRLDYMFPRIVALIDRDALVSFF